MCSPWDADEKIHLERYHNLVRLFETLQIDNMKTLKAVIYPMEELQIGTTKAKVNFLLNPVLIT
jgi:hypothetical protein